MNIWGVPVRLRFSLDSVFAVSPQDKLVVVGLSLVSVQSTQIVDRLKRKSKGTVRLFQPRRKMTTRGVTQ